MTNADKIRSMSNTDLAKIIMCPYDTDPDMCLRAGCLECCIDWLDMPAERERE